MGRKNKNKNNQNNNNAAADEVEEVEVTSTTEETEAVAAAANVEENAVATTEQTTEENAAAAEEEETTPAPAAFERTTGNASPLRADDDEVAQPATEETEAVAEEESAPVPLPVDEDAVAPAQDEEVAAPPAEETAAEEVAAADATEGEKAEPKVVAEEEVVAAEQAEEPNTAAAEEVAAEEAPAAAAAEEEAVAVEQAVAQEENAAEEAVAQEAPAAAAEEEEAAVAEGPSTAASEVDSDEKINPDEVASPVTATTATTAAEEEEESATADDEEAEEADEVIAPTPIPAVEFNESEAVVPSSDALVFTDEETAAMASDANTVESSINDAERATRQRIATLRKAFFTARALKRQADARVAAARTAAAIEGDVAVGEDANASSSSSSSSPSSSYKLSLAAALREKATAVEAEDAQLDATIATHGMAKARMMGQYKGCLTALFKLTSFETFLATTLADHVKAMAINANKPQGADVEEKVLEHIRELVAKRNAEAARLEGIKERIKKTAAELRRGHQVEKPSKVPSIAGHNGVASTASATAAMQASPLIGSRTSVAREDHEDPANASDEVVELQEFNAAVGKEVLSLSDLITKLTKERTALSAKLSLTKAANRKAEANMTDELKKKTLRLRADTKAIEDLQRTNAALISTVETLMHQLNNEYYGAGERPAIGAAAGGSSAGPTKKALRLEDKKMASSGNSPDPRKK